MKTFIGIVLIFVSFSNLFSQNQSSALQKIDSIWIQDVEEGMHVYVKFKVHLLSLVPEEIELLLENLDSVLIADLDHLDKIYKTEVNNFKIGYSEFMLRKDDKLYGYAYLGTIIEFEKFLVFPNIYGILLNPNRLNINPKLDKGTREVCEELVNKIHDSIFTIQPKKLIEIKRFIEEFQRNAPDDFHKINQGGLSETEKSKYKFIDFLILMNRQTKKN